VGPLGSKDAVERSSARHICREMEIDIVASDAISRASEAERGIVVNTTKNGMEAVRENVKEWARVT
jgi:hypothetical protein